MDAFESVLNSWLEIEKKITEDGVAQDLISDGEWFYREIINLAAESVTKCVDVHSASEFARIFSRSVRRYHILLSHFKFGYLDATRDGLRSLLELMFQAFYLLRVPNRPQVALDAKNLSWISSIKAAERLYASGELIHPTLTEEEARAKQWVERYVLPKYRDRRPRFYADLSVSRIAEGAKLKRVYDLTYNWLSAHVHNEPVSDAENLINEFELQLNVKPNFNDFKESFPEFIVGTQVFILTSLGSLSAIADVDKESVEEILGAFVKKYEGSKWDNEITCICENWNIKLNK
jgi:Family of unknown function (DUF5677)